MHGYVYILINPSFEDIKIGKTSRPIEERVKELDNTSTPTPFEIYGYAYTYKFNEIEKTIHDILTKLTDTRTRTNREFFKYPAKDAYELLKQLVELTADGYIEKCKFKNSNYDSKTKRNSDFKFSMVGLKPGDKINFIHNNLEVEVYNESKIKYKDKIYSMSGFAKEFTPKNLKNNSNNYNGPRCFKYNGKVLTNLRFKDAH
jgi:hypothetical protein